MIFKCLKKRKKEKPFESVSIRDDLDHINKQVFGTFNPNSLTLKEDEAAVLGEGQEQGKRTRKQSEDFHNARIKRRLESIDEKANDGWIPSFFNFLVSSNNNNADNDEDSVGGQKCSSSPRRSTRSASRRSSVRASMSRMMGYKEDNHDLITASELHEVLRKRFPDDEFGRESDFPRFFPNNEGSKKTKKISISKSVAIIEKHRDWMQNDCSKENADLAMELIPKNWIRKGGVDNDGAPCVYIQGARFDNKIDPTLYAIAVGALVRNMFDPAFGGEDHDSDDARGKVTVMIDVRAGNLKEPGTNYTNPSPASSAFLGMVRAINEMLPAHFPGRTKQCIIYPLPRIAIFAWKAISKFLGEEARKKVFIINGGDNHNSPAPLKLAEFVNIDTFLEEDAKRVHLILEEPK